MKNPAPIRLAAILALTTGLVGCAATDPRVTDRAPGAVPPNAAAARLTDEAIRADHRAIDQVRDRLAALNQTGRVPTTDPHWAKAQCWLDMARQNYHENDRSTVIEQAIDEASLLVGALEKGTPPADRTPAIGRSVRLREDLWARVARVKAEPAARCAAARAACLEVQLVAAGHEYAEGGWRHANPYIGIAEQQADQMDQLARGCAPAPAVVAVAPPAPAVEREVRVERLVLTTDALFDFDRSGLNHIRGAGRARLDALAARALALPGIERIVLTGHTDRLGDPAYNQALSVQRAGAVRDHLVSRGVPASVFVVSGRGAEQPIKACGDGLPRERLIACLQDNRRVEVEIVTSPRREAAGPAR